MLVTPSFPVTMEQTFLLLLLLLALFFFFSVFQRLKSVFYSVAKRKCTLITILQKGVL